MSTHEPIFTRPYKEQDVLGISPSTVYRCAKAGHIELIKRGSMSFVRTSEVKEYIEGLGDHLGD